MSEEGLFSIEGSTDVEDVRGQISYSVTTIDPMFQRLVVEYADVDEIEAVLDELESVSGVSSAGYAGDPPEDL